MLFKVTSTPASSFITSPFLPLPGAAFSLVRRQIVELNLLYTNMPVTMLYLPWGYFFSKKKTLEMA